MKEQKQTRRMSRRAAILAAALMTLAAPALANVAITNFMDAEFNVAPACLVKSVGEDVASFPDGFNFSAVTQGSVDNVAVTQEHVTIDGVQGDRVLADEVFIITNNCTVDLDVSIVNAAGAGTWTEKHLEVWLGNTTNAGSYPAVDPAPGFGEWDQNPVVFEPTGVTNTATGVVSVPANGGSVPVGMVVTTGAASAGKGTATWQVQAVAS